MKAEDMDKIIASAELRNPKVFNANRERYVAEISLKEGEIQGKMDMLLDQPSLISEAVQAGMKTVVEWVEENCRMTWEHGEGEVAFNHVKWHKQLEDWRG